MAGCRRRAPTTARGSSKRRVWIVDPIDGTRAYLGGREDWSISAALVEAGKPRLAAVFAPATDEFFFASERRRRGAQRRRDHGVDGTDFDIERMAGPHFLLNRVRGTTSPELKQFQDRLARAAHQPRRAGRARCGVRRRQQPRLGSCGRRSVAARSRRPADDAHGDALVYNRVEVTHEVLVAAGRERHAQLVSHLAQH